MPTLAASDREDHVLRLVCKALSDGARQVAIEARPDRSPPGMWPYTVDALLTISMNGQSRRWAADICTVPYQQEMPAADAELRRKLEPELDRLARQYGHAVLVSYEPTVRPVGVPTRAFARKVDAMASAVVAEAEKALQRGPGMHHFEHAQSVHVSGNPQFDDGSRTGLLPWISGPDPSIGTQLDRDLRPVVEGKLAGQLAKARALRVPTVLILDQVGAVDMKVPPNYLASEHAIADLVEACAAAATPNTLDAAIVINGNNEVKEIIGCVGVARLDQTIP